jgi:hypothetical protein
MDTLQTLMFFACCFSALYVLAWWGWQILVVKPHQDVFKGSGVTLSIDHASKHLTYATNMGEQLSIPFNSLDISYFQKVEYKTYEKWHHGTSAKVNLYTTNGFTSGSITPETKGYLEKGTKEVITGDTAITMVVRDMPQYFFRKWATWNQDSTGKKSKAPKEEIVRFDLTNRQASALKRWVSAHRKLIAPNEAVVREVWDEKCRALLEKCRAQRPKGSKANCIEAFEYSADFTIKYLYCTDDGRIFLAAGQDPVLMEVDLKSVRFWSTKGQYSMNWYVQVEQVLFKLETNAHVAQARKILGKESVMG